LRVTIGWHRHYVKCRADVESRRIAVDGSSGEVTIEVANASPSRDLGAGIAARRFRGDLYARLAQFEVRLRPLRDRREDVLLLLLHALGESARRLTPRLAEALLLHD